MKEGDKIFWRWKDAKDKTWHSGHVKQVEGSRVKICAMWYSSIGIWVSIADIEYEVRKAT